MMNPVKYLLIGLVQFYRWFLSPLKTALFGPVGRCRYTPSCSAYALEAIRRHGVFCGVWLAVCRVGRCHPWADHGDDPVPEKKPRRPGSGDRRCGQRHHEAHSPSFFN